MTNACTFDEGQQQLFVFHTLFLVSFLFSQMYGKTHTVTKSILTFFMFVDQGLSALKLYDSKLKT